MKEYETFAALEKASALFVKRVEGLGDDCEEMAAAGVGEHPRCTWDKVLC